jgi:hypothetical protein
MWLGIGDNSPKCSAGVTRMVQLFGSPSLPPPPSRLHGVVLNLGFILHLIHISSMSNVNYDSYIALLVVMIYGVLNILHMTATKLQNEYD